MDSIFLDQLDPNEIPPRPPQKGAKIFYDSTGTLKVRKFASIEPIYGMIDSSDISDATTAGRAMLTAESNAYQANLLPRTGLYVSSYFKTAVESIFTATSVDGINWYEIGSPKNFIGVRDPSMIFWNGYWYASHTVNGFTPPESRFAILRSADGINWEHYRYVDMATVVPAATNVWAPALQIVNDKVICLAAVKTTGDFTVYLIQDWDDYLATNGTPTPIAGLATNSIDAEVTFYNGTYYMFYKNEDTAVIEASVSTTIEGPYTVVKTGDWAGWGTPREAPNVIRLPSGNWRMYMDNYSGTLYSDSATDDLLGTWSAATAISGISSRHITVQNVPAGASNIASPFATQPESRMYYFNRNVSANEWTYSASANATSAQSGSLVNTSLTSGGSAGDYAKARSQIQGIVNFPIANEFFISFGMDSASLVSGEVSSFLSFGSDAQTTGNITANGFGVRFLATASNNIQLYVHNGTTLYSNTVTYSGGGALSNNSCQFLLHYNGEGDLSLYGNSIHTFGRMQLIGSVTATTAPSGSMNPLFYWNAIALSTRTISQYMSIRDFSLMIK